MPRYCAGKRAIDIQNFCYMMKAISPVIFNEKFLSFFFSDIWQTCFV